MLQSSWLSLEQLFKLSDVSTFCPTRMLFIFMSQWRLGSVGQMKLKRADSLVNLSEHLLF